MTPRFDRRGNFRCAGGESVRPALQILDQAGVPVVLTGRAFVLRILTVQGELLAAPIAGQVVGDQVTFPVPGATTIPFAGRAGLKIQLSELLADGRDDWLTADLVVSQGGPIATGAGTSAEDIVAIDPRGALVISTRGAPGNPAIAFAAADEETPRSAIERVREFDIEAFRTSLAGPPRSDATAFLAMFDKARTLATDASPRYSTLRWIGDLRIDGGAIMGDGFPTGCELIGYGRRRSRLVVTANDATTRGKVIDTRGASYITLSDFSIVYGSALSPEDFAIVLDAGVEQIVKRIGVSNGYGTLLIGRTGAVSRSSVSKVFHASMRGARGGDHVRVQWAASLDLQRIRMNTSEEMTGAFYRLAPAERPDVPLSPMLIDTIKMIDCQGQNSVHEGLSTGDGLILDCTFGNIYSGTTLGCIFDHTFGIGIGYVSRPYSVAGAPMKSSIRNWQHVHARNSADAGVSRHADHQGAGRMTQIKELGGYAQISLGAAVEILPKGAGYYEALEFEACSIRSTASISGGETIPAVFDIAGDLEFLGGTISKLGENDATMPKLGIVRGGAQLTFVLNKVDNIVDRTFSFPDGVHPDTLVTLNPGMRQEIGTARRPIHPAAELTVDRAASVGAGGLVYCPDGNAGVPCLAVSTGAAWYRVPLAGVIA